jgi:uncharacterized membrane protein
MLACLHVMAVIAWFAGLFCLRLFVYHAGQAQLELSEI